MGHTNPLLCPTQGREKEVTIFSTVRSSKGAGRGIGFVADEQRINVGLTRARCSSELQGLAQGRNQPAFPAPISHSRLQGFFAGCGQRGRAAARRALARPCLTLSQGTLHVPHRCWLHQATQNAGSDRLCPPDPLHQRSLTPAG